MAGISREDAKLCVNLGWAKLIDDVYDNLPPQVSVMEVKEKWGGLRIYVDTETIKFLKYLDSVEKRSFQVCEICGEPGRLIHRSGWLMTRCPKHI